MFKLFLFLVAASIVGSLSADTVIAAFNFTWQYIDSAPAVTAQSVSVEA